MEQNSSLTSSHVRLSEFHLFLPKTLDIQTLIALHFHSATATATAAAPSMIPRSISMDTHLRSQESLSSTILSSNTPAQISAAVNSITTFLQRRPPPNQSRHFFSISFPALLLKLFAFDSPSSPSAWIDLTDTKVSNLLFDLLSPDGSLFGAIAAVDSLSLVRYAFPVERLPEWMRYVLMHSDGKHHSVLSDLCLLFTSRVREDNQFEVNVFEYYMLWFAYYPVCKGGGGVKPAVKEGSRKSSGRLRLENWASSMPGLSTGRRPDGVKKDCGLYLRLFYAYLQTFIPLGYDNLCQPYRSSLLHCSVSYNDGSVVSRAEFVVNVFVQFWMINNDFSPLPLTLCQSFGLNFPMRTVLAEAPPSSGLGPSLKLLLNYVNSGLISSRSGNESGLKVQASYSYDVGLMNLLMQRPLYRFVLRTFLFCPMGTSMSNVSQVFALWMSYLEPWKISGECFVEFEQSLTETKSGDVSQKEGKESYDIQSSTYSSAWQGYVLSNYLFYTSLAVHFLGFSHKFLHANVEVVIQMVLKLMKILTSSTELIDLLIKVDTAYHSKSSRSSSATFNSCYKFIPSIREQLKDWEDCLCETDADGSYLREKWNSDLRFFNDGEDGAQHLLQLLIIRAEPEIQSMTSDDTTRNLQNLASLRTQVNILFGTPKCWNLSSPSPSKPTFGDHEVIFTPKHPGFGKRTWADVKYTGDWMRRPVSDCELAWLVKYLVRLSDFLNESLDLNEDGNHEDVVPGPSCIEVVPPNESNGVHGFKDAIWMFLVFVGSLLAMLFKVILKFTRKRGWRINLRALAAKKVILALVVCVAVSALKKKMF